MSLASYVRKWLEINGIPKEVEKIVGYCIRKENGKVFDDWGEDIITTMVTYHMMKKTISVVYDGDEVVGVHMWYNCNYDDGWDFIKNWEEDKPNGDTVFLAFLFADNKEAMRKLTIDLIEREPDVLTKNIISIRQRNGGPERVEYSLKFLKKLLKA
jgi:hypothetical protein